MAHLVNHVALLTADTDRLHAFYGEVFGATVAMDTTEDDGFRISIVEVGPSSSFNVFELDGNTEAARQTPAFGRGRIDHVGRRRRRARRSTRSAGGCRTGRHGRAS